jgi:DDE superfamily endonuclease
MKVIQPIYRITTYISCAAPDVSQFTTFLRSLMKESRGRIEARKFPAYPAADNAYAIQESAWIDKRVMLMWVRTILQPFLEDVPANIQPSLLLDSYRCHTMAPVTEEIEAMGVQIEIIPGGCTGMCQPIDVGIGKTIKTLARHLWE